MKTLEDLKKDYQAYDKRQKAYIKQLEKQVQDYKYMYEDKKAELNEYVKEVCDKKELTFKGKYMAIKEILKTLQAKYDIMKNDEKFQHFNEISAQHDMDIIKENKDLRDRNKELSRQIKELREARDRLLSKLATK